LEVIQYFINLQIKGTKKIDFNSHRSYSLFHEACLSEHAGVVKLFLKYADDLAMDLNSDRGGDGQRPFGKSLLFGKSFETLELLLEDDRIDVNAADNQGSTPLMDIYGATTNRWRDEDKIVEIIDLLQKSPRIDVNLMDKKGRTPFHFACQHENSRKDGRRAEMLLKMAEERGDIDVNQKDKKGKTPTHLAFEFQWGYHGPFVPPFVLSKFSATIEVILKHVKLLSIDLNAIDNDGKTPLHYLYSSRKQSLVSQFLEAAQNEYGISFDCNIVDRHGRTPIQYAHGN